MVLIGVSLSACGSGIGTPARVVLYEERQQNPNDIEPRIIVRDRERLPSGTEIEPRILAPNRGQRRVVKEAQPRPATPASRPTPEAAPTRGEITRIELPPPKNMPSSNHVERNAVDAASHADVPKDGTHSVQRGDTVYAVSRRYGVPVRAIIRANELDPQIGSASGWEQVCR